MTQYQFNVNSQSVTGVLTWNSNSTLQQLVITDPFNSTDSQTCNYVYDDIARLSSANCGSVSGTYAYDAFGNLDKSGSFSFQALYTNATTGQNTNRYISIPGATVSYDANGNVLSDGSHTYTWDANGRPLTIDSVGLTYDALGRMAEQNRSGAYTQIVYAPTGQKLALMSAATLQKAFIPLPGNTQAVYASSGLSYYRHPDWLGSSRLASTPTPPTTMYSDTAYAPFGEPYAQAGATDLSFTGQNQDTVAGGLIGPYDFPAREYGPQGRWVSPDPSGLAAVEPTNPQSWDRYAYVSGNPLNNVDPLGLSKLAPPSPDVQITIYQSWFLSDCMWYSCIITSNYTPGAQVGAFSTNSDPTSDTYDPGCTDANPYSGCNSPATGFNMTSPSYQLNAEFRQAYANYVNEVNASLNPGQAVYQPIPSTTGPQFCVAQAGMICTSTGLTWIVAPPGMLWILTPISSSSPWAANLINGFGVLGVRNKTTTVVH